jgi:glycosyltransferase involved in cell wall biosynthesis
MRIGFDAREIAGHMTGAGRYLASLLEAWGENASAAHHEFVMYVPAPPGERWLPLIGRLSAAVNLVRGRGGTWWEQVQLPPAVNRDRLDVFFAPAYTAPLRLSCPTVLTIHDLSYMAHPEWFRRSERWRRTLVTRAAASRARHILTDTVFSRNEIVRLLGTPTARLSVIPLGMGLPPRPSAHHPREPLVLFVGSIFNRRRVPDLIQAFATIPGTPRLEIVGDNRTWPALDLESCLREHGVSSRARLRSWVTDDELEDLYGRASVFVFLSEYEGFGLTPLEALARGVPIVVLDTPVAHEVYGDAAWYVPAGDIPGTAAAISRLLGTGPDRDRILAAAAERVPRYSWPVAAASTLAAIEQAAK